MTPIRKDSDQVSREQRSLLRRLVAAALRLPVAAYCYLFKSTKTSAGRRALLRGQFWKLAPSGRFAPLVTRLPPPQPRVESPTAEQPRSISGINIEPVPVDNPVATQVPQGIPLHRPPGAVAEPQFLAGCTRCSDCIEACPYDAIHHAPDRLGKAAGTPIIRADVVACMMCEDFPCIASCKPGVLTEAIPPIMGTARVTPHLCLAYHHTTCTVCSERCPVDDAITICDGKPTINESVCTGCGVCRYVCPAPENAILHMPAFVRPGLPNR